MRLKTVPKIVFLLVFSLSSVSLIAGKAMYFPPVTDIRATLGQNSGKVTVLLVSQSDCPPCKQLSERVLKPLEKSGKYSGKVAFREISLDDGNTIVNFDGKTVSTRVFLQAYKVEFSPVLFFFGANGEELNPAQFGIGPLDYHSFYVEKAIEESFRNMNPKPEKT